MESDVIISVMHIYFEDVIDVVYHFSKTDIVNRPYVSHVSSGTCQASSGLRNIDHDCLMTQLEKCHVSAE